MGIIGVPKESVPHSREAWGDEYKRLYKAELEAWGKTLKRDRSYDDMMKKLADVIGNREGPSMDSIIEASRICVQNVTHGKLSAQVMIIFALAMRRSPTRNISVYRWIKT